jgi:methionyl-tRNA synthetase
VKQFYITTAIDYANGNPHLGHAYEKVLADVIARHRRLKGNEVYFLTGLDEHGQKVQQSANNRGVHPSVFCDAIAEEFKGLCSRLILSNNMFIRTTEQRHGKVVQRILQHLYDKGEIYKADYAGFYSVRAEQFVQEKDKVDGEWPAVYGNVVRINESNYFFKLSQYQDWLVQYIKKNEKFIFPAFRQKQVLEFLKEPINDLCISRPIERLFWGIPLPFDREYVTYVWFDALINYISAIGYGSDDFEKYWPADFHIIGKDILVPSHAVYWPIMLKACGIEQPKSILVHGWWLKSGEKMSKSTGQGINPLDFIERFGPDAFRYFLIREMNVGQDSEFSEELFMRRYNSDLANDLGNLVNRLLNMAERYSESKIPTISLKEDPESDLEQLWRETHQKVLEDYEGFQFHHALAKIFIFISAINRYAEIRAPWNLAKSKEKEDRQRLETALVTMAEGIRLASVLLSPVMPVIVNKILSLLSCDPICKWQGELDWSTRLQGNCLGEKTILFPRL